MVLQLLEAADFLHQQKTVHRDIKPPNLLIREPDHVRLTDFGLAKRYNEAGGLTSLNQGMGTLMYMSPEQVQNVRDAREPADLYSIGVTLYYLLTGKYTFDFPTQRDVEEVMKQDPKKFKSHKEALAWLMRANRIQHPFNIILTDEPTSIRNREASIPKRLADVVDKAVKKEIGERYRSAAEFRAALNGAIG
jgi:serine/threonine-protein kinase